MLADISRALNEKFYRERDSGLLAYLQSHAEEDKLRDQLAKISQISDVVVLDNLIEAGVTAESFMAFSLYPWVWVAWEDGKIDDSEREAVMKAAETEGISTASTSYQLLQSWLSELPDLELEDAWRSYASALARELDEASLESIRTVTFARTRQVARAAGGILGLGNKISKNEERTLLDLIHAFDKPVDLQ